VTNKDLVADSKSFTAVPKNAVSARTQKDERKKQTSDHQCIAIGLLGGHGLGSLCKRTCAICHALRALQQC
jgi:hypothetical protein